MKLTLEWHLRMIMGLEFSVSAKVPGFLLFKDSKKRANYSLYYTGLSENQILEVARIIDEVYQYNNRDNRGTHREVPTISLNGVGDLSRDFVNTVLELDASAMHKFLLLTSGYFLASSGNDRTVIKLAESKPESYGDPKEFFTSKSLSENLTEFYILPGATDKTNHAIFRIVLNSAIMRHEVEFIAKLLIFFARDSPTTTLGNQLALEDYGTLRDSFQSGNVETFRIIETLIAVNSEYEELAHTLTAKELNALAFLMQGELTKIPTDFLKSRVKAMSQSTNNRHLGGWLVTYLSPYERNTLDPEEIAAVSETLNSVYRGRGANPEILYGAIAEVFVQKGYHRTIDVISEIEVIFRYPALPISVIEAAVLLILEAVKEENDEMPFSWAAQLNENSWVLHSNKNPNEFGLKVELALKA